MDRLRALLGPPYSHSGSEISSAERALWRAVILQALMDAASGSAKAEARGWRNAALGWLMHGGAGFNLVCDLAGLEPSCVRRKAKKALLAQCKWRAEPGMGRRYVSHRDRPDVAPPEPIETKSMGYL